MSRLEKHSNPSLDNTQRRNSRSSRTEPITATDGSICAWTLSAMLFGKERNMPSASGQHGRCCLIALGGGIGQDILSHDIRIELSISATRPPCFSTPQFP